jgi:hypothetical protein
MSPKFLSEGSPRVGRTAGAAAISEAAKGSALTTDGCGEARGCANPAKRSCTMSDRLMRGATLLAILCSLGCGSSSENASADGEQYDPVDELVLDGKADSTTNKVVIKGSIAFGQTVDSAFDDSKYHGYTFSAAKGAVLGAELTGDSPATDTVVMVYGPKSGASWSGSPRAKDDNGFAEGSKFAKVTSMVIPEDGEYLIVATCKNRSYRDKPYHLSLQCEQGDCAAMVAQHPRASWTVLVYGSFDTHDEDGIPSSLADMQFKMTADNPDVYFLYLEDLPGSGNTKLFEVHPRRADVVKDYGELHLGNPNTLTEILRFVRESYPSDSLFLDMIGHTSSAVRAFGPDYTPDPGAWDKQRFMYWQIPEAILASGGRIDVLALSGCGSGDLEIAARMADAADYVAGLQEYNTGYTDVRWADSLSRNSSISARGLSWRVAQGLFQNGYNLQGQPGATGAYDLAQIQNAKSALTELAAALLANMDSHASEYVQARRNALQMTNFSFYVDAYDFAQQLESLCTSSSVVDKARTFRAALDQLLVGGGAPTYADEENHANAHGINLIFPTDGTDAFFDEASAWKVEEQSYYEQTGWRAFVAQMQGRF